MSAADFLPEKKTLTALRKAAQGCRGCPLWKDATQTVFGEGRPSVRLVLVGEQPGDREDREGAPFVGPAGALLDRALEEASILREEVYLTNAVKHFKWRSQGKRRLHQTPRAGEVEACKPWLEAEVATVAPGAVMALGATAAKALFGNTVRVTKDRGQLLEASWAPIAAVTVHPSAILRTRGAEEKDEAFAGLVEDLEMVVAALNETSPDPPRRNGG